MQESLEAWEQNEMWCCDKIVNLLRGSTSQLASLSSMTYLTAIEKISSLLVSFSYLLIWSKYFF